MCWYTSAGATGACILATCSAAYFACVVLYLCYIAVDRMSGFDACADEGEIRSIHIPTMEVDSE